MGYVEGKELKDYFDSQERFSLEEIVRLMRELLGALGHAHSHGIVHRDIKPANIFILKNVQAKVGDFGIALIELSLIHISQWVIPSVIATMKKTLIVALLGLAVGNAFALSLIHI